MMLRTLAVLGLSTATVTATMASVKDGAATGRPTSSTTESKLGLNDEMIRVPAFECGRLPILTPTVTAPEELAPAIRLRKQASEDLRLPAG